MVTYLIMSGASTCTDIDEMHGTVADEAEAKSLVARLNAAGHKYADRGYGFFYEALGPFVGVDHPTLTRSLKGPVPDEAPGEAPSQGPGR